MPEANRLFSLFPSSSRAFLLREARIVELPAGMNLYGSERLVQDVYFLTSGVASTVVNMRDGSSAEIGLIGNEGIVGGGALLGEMPMQAQCCMQMSGAGLRISLGSMKRCFEEVPEVRQVVSAFLQSQIIISAQLSACNRLHEAQARLARWLLVSSDQTQSESLIVTQESLGQLLGIRRTTVALVAGHLQRRGWISYSRGRVQICDRAGLSKVSCECYEITRRITANLYSHPKFTAPSTAYDGATPCYMPEQIRTQEIR